MDGLIPLIMIAVLFAKIFSRNKKKSGAAPGTKKFSGLERTLTELEKWSKEQEVKVSFEPATRAVDRKAELKAKYGEKLRQQKAAGQEVSYEGISRPLAPSEELKAGRASGSIVFHSDEGNDICDPTLMHGESGLETPASPVFQPHAENEPFLTADDLVRGFVMSEILNRPSGNRYAKMR